MVVRKNLLIALGVTGCFIGGTGCKPRSKGALKAPEAWDSANSPEQFNARKLKYDDFSKPEYLQGEVVTKPWSDTYWPLYNAGITARWIDEINFPALPLSEGKLDSSLSAAEISAKGAALEAESILLVQGFRGKKFEESAAVSLAEKVDLVLDRPNFDLTRKELQSFVRNTINYKDISWSWMGHCHGWAAASILYPKPLHGVMMTGVNGKEVLFTPGDIRGILTKGASDAGFSTRNQFLGTRCNDASSNIPKDLNGRYIDGSLGIQPGASDSLAKSVEVRIIKNNWSNLRELGEASASVTFKVMTPGADQSVWWLVEDPATGSRSVVKRVKIYSTKSTSGGIVRDQIVSSSKPAEVGVFVDVSGKPIYVNGAIKRDEASAKAKWAKALKGGPSELLSEVGGLYFKSWKECRDLNAGTFHLVLASLLSDGGRGSQVPRGFVLDVTRDDQVWNHPIYSFESKMGAPTPLTIGDKVDPNIAWRSPEAVSIVDVHTQMIYGVENGPNIVYTDADDTLSEVSYRYTLELDKNGVVVGGEWHLSEGYSSSTPLSGEELLVNLGSTAVAEQTTTIKAPDFIWGYPVGSKVRDSSLIPSRLIEKLHACSISQGTTENLTINGNVVPYVKCNLN